MIVNNIVDDVRSKQEDPGPAISISGIEAAQTDGVASKEGKFRARRGSTASSHRSGRSSHRSRRSGK